MSRRVFGNYNGSNAFMDQTAENEVLQLMNIQLRPVAVGRREVTVDGIPSLEDQIVHPGVNDAVVGHQGATGGVVESQISSEELVKLGLKRKVYNIEVDQGVQAEKPDDKAANSPWQSSSDWKLKFFADYSGGTLEFELSVDITKPIEAFKGIILEKTNIAPADQEWFLGEIHLENMKTLRDQNIQRKSVIVIKKRRA
ncbi:hypothetical protein BsWGS_12423 [Bradybaena similaris]